VTADDLPLPTLLSRLLIEFTIEFDSEAEHRLEHRTTLARRAAPAVAHGWCRKRCGPTSCSSSAGTGYRCTRLTTSPASPTWPGLQQYPDGWRARGPYLRQTTAVLNDPGAALPHYPMMLHRGGWPDGN